MADHTRITSTDAVRHTLLSSLDLIEEINDAGGSVEGAIVIFVGADEDGEVQLSGTYSRSSLSYLEGLGTMSRAIHLWQDNILMQPCDDE
jgi:hypothetical protein